MLDPGGPLQVRNAQKTPQDLQVKLRFRKHIKMVIDNTHNFVQIDKGVQTNSYKNGMFTERRQPSSWSHLGIVPRDKASAETL